MITVYDMTAGTLQKDIEASSAPAQEEPAMQTHEQVEYDLRLEEIEFESPAKDSLPSDLLNINTADFITSMK